MGHVSHLRASGSEIYTSALLVGLSLKQKKSRTKLRRGRDRGVPLKQKKPLKTKWFQLKLLLSGPSRDVSKEVLVGPTKRLSFRFESSDDEQGKRR